jgi:hypothetical protein
MPVYYWAIAFTICRIHADLEELFKLREEMDEKAQQSAVDHQLESEYKAYVPLVLRRRWIARLTSLKFGPW